MGKPSICGKTGLKKGMWTPEEDKLLSAYITRYGHWNWRQLPKYAGLLRCGKSCRLRWMNYLRPDLKRGNFTGQEEELILKLHEQLGNRWSTIAESLPGRTDNEIKNHWHTHLNKPAKPKTPAEKKGKKKQVASQGSSHHINITPVILESSDVLPLPTPMASTMSPLPVEKSTDTATVVTEDGTAKSASDFGYEPFFVEEDFMWDDITPNYLSEVYDDVHCLDIFFDNWIM